MVSKPKRSNTPRPAVVAPTVKTPPVSVEGTVISLRSRPLQMKKALMFFSNLQRTMSRKLGWMIGLWLLWSAGTFLYTRSLFQGDDYRGNQVVQLAGVAVVCYLIFYSLCKLCSPVRWINISGCRCWSMVVWLPLLCLASWFFLSTLFLMFGPIQEPELLLGWRTLHDQIALWQRPLNGIHLLIVSEAWLLVFAGLHGIIRYSRVTPNADEMKFGSEIVGWILNDLSPESKCSLTLRPFDSMWTAFQGAPVRGKAAEYDDILDFSAALSPTVRLRISAVHRRTSKGTRKHKGYKHKVKTRIDLIDSARAGPVSDGKRFRNLILKVLEDTNVAGKITGSWAEVTGAEVLVSNRDTGLSVTVVTGGVRISGQLKSADMPHPHQILALVSGVTKTISL